MATESTNHNMRIITRPAQKWVIDRFEETWAVLECVETRESITLLISTLPKGSRPGATLVKTGSGWLINEADTRERAENIRERFERLKSCT